MAADWSRLSNLARFQEAKKAADSQAFIKVCFAAQHTSHIDELGWGPARAAQIC